MYIEVINLGVVCIIVYIAYELNLTYCMFDKSKHFLFNKLMLHS